MEFWSTEPLDMLFVLGNRKRPSRVLRVRTVTEKSLQFVYSFLYRIRMVKFQVQGGSRSVTLRVRTPNLARIWLDRFASEKFVVLPYVVSYGRMLLAASDY